LPKNRGRISKRQPTGQDDSVPQTGKIEDFFQGAFFNTAIRNQSLADLSGGFKSRSADRFRMADMHFAAQTMLFDFEMQILPRHLRDFRGLRDIAVH